MPCILCTTSAGKQQKLLKTTENTHNGLDMSVFFDGPIGNCHLHYLLKRQTGPAAYLFASVDSQLLVHRGFKGVLHYTTPVDDDQLCSTKAGYKRLSCSLATPTILK